MSYTPDTKGHYMHSKRIITLSVALLCITLFAQDTQPSQNPFMQNFFKAQAKPTATYSNEEIDKLVTVLRAIAQEDNVKLEDTDIAFQAQLQLLCKQVHEQTGTLMTPLELFNNMNIACQDIGAWKMFCAENGLDYMSPMQLFEQFVAAQQKTKHNQTKNVISLGAGVCIGGVGALIYADSIKSALQHGGIFTVSQLIEHHQQLTQKMPLTSVQRLALNIILDASVNVGKYHAQAHQSANAEIIGTINRRLRAANLGDIDIDCAVQFVKAQHEKGALLPLRYDEKYKIGKKDYALLVANSAAANLIDAIPVPAQNSVYLSLHDETLILLSQNLLIRAAKESGKACVQQAIQAQLSSNNAKIETDPSKLTNLRPQDVARILAINSAKELGYSLASQIAHKKIAPQTDERTAALLQTIFPADGVPKTEMHEVGRLVTIGAVTLCATTGFNLAKKAGNWTLNHILNASVGLLGA